jgi:hypothetical protein
LLRPKSQSQDKSTEEVMLRSTLIGLMALGVMAGAATAQTKMDCSRLYKDFWEKFDREKYAKISAEQLAGVSRMALRAYDACQAGDEQDAKALFDRLNRMQF